MSPRSIPSRLAFLNIQNTTGAAQSVVWNKNARRGSLSPQRRPAGFTRQRVLTFPVLMLLIQKSLKSLQAHLHEFLGQMATSLLEAETYPADALGAVYWRCWGQETHYGRLKGRLDLEHASGQSVEAVEQDFQASVLLANVESVVSGPAQQELAVRTAGRAQPARVNRAVSLHALKHRLIELLTSRVPAAAVLAELTRSFQATPAGAARTAASSPPRVPAITSAA